MIPETALLASSTLRNTPRMVFTACGSGSNRTITSVQMPSVPSDPTKRPSKSYPAWSANRPPNWTISPLGRTTVAPSTWFLVAPYFRQCGPPAFSATFPPMVQACWLAGSGAKKNPRGVTARLIVRFTHPASTVAVRLGRSISRMRFMRVRTISTPPAVAMAPPESPVPAPRGTIGTPSVAQSRTTDATWSVLVGKTTRSGAARWCVVSASRSYTRSSSGANTTPSVPTIF